MKKILVTLFILSCPAIRAQINIQGSVYGGARQADVTGSTNVTIGGEATAHDIVINRVYGGNDISGSIGEDGAKVETKATGEKGLFIGQLYGGGNGDYDYTEDGTDAEGNVTYTVKETASATEPLATKARKPEIAKVALKLEGGTFGYVFGGGNAVTVTGATDIFINNATQPMTDNSVLTLPESIDLTKLSEELAKPVNQRLMDMGINITTFRRGYHFLRVFGGNNKAAMRIRPTWHLEKGSIINLYSGGNEGDMTSPVGLLLEIAANSDITVENVYGGCRKADVHPLDASGNDVASANIQLTDTDENGNLKYKFPAGLSARVLVRGGHITNVYGGNDISGKVTGGNAVGIYHSISGDVYGGGNGSYAYTDKSEFANDILWGDFYYDPGTSSVEALNNHRPNAEQVSLRVKGTDAGHPTVIGGSIYVGGNSATLKPSSSISNPMVELKVGSYVIADNVFLGNNGENMVDSKDGGVLWQYKQSLKPQEGRGESDTPVRFSSLDLTNADIFKKYMDGCAMNMLPAVVFDNTGNGDPDNYEHYSTSFGSLFCGGNVGSMTYPGVNDMDFSAKIIIFDKVVGGCNNAFVPAVTGLNAAYEGGILGSSEEQASYVDDSGKTKDRLLLNFRGAKLVPKRWKMKTVEGKETYDLDANDNRQLEWNTVKWETHDNAAPTLTPINPTDGQTKDRRLKGGNVYGGCYNSGRVNGNVVININSALTDEAEVFGESYSGVDKAHQYNDVLASALNVFGGGYGADSEISGNTTININGGYAFQTYGGGEMGKVTGNCTTNFLNNGRVEYIYGGGMEGDVTGNTITHLGDGTCVGVIGGACNANIDGHTEVYIGDLGFPTITEDVYGGNDFGGSINGEADFSGKVSELAENKVYDNKLLTASAYVEYVQGNVTENVFGGSYGNYNYKDKLYRKYTDAEGTVKSGFSKPHLKSAFLNFRPNSNGSSSVAGVYGGSEGYSGEANNNKMQDRSYVLVDFQANNDNFAAMPVFGAGDYAGIGFGVDKATADANADGVTAAAIVDLITGQVGNVYGASYKEGFTRHTVVNVPAGSTIKVNSLFGGAYGLDNAVACDAYEATVNYSSEQALVSGAVFGGNNHARRTLYGTVNINVPVHASATDDSWLATVYGAGMGVGSWSQYTEVNLNDGARVFEVYGGGMDGLVMNTESVAKLSGVDRTMPSGYTDTGLDNALAHYTDLSEDIESHKIKFYDEHGKLKTVAKKKYNTNVHINAGAEVRNYAYGGGLGHHGVTPYSGNVYGTTYIDLLGGKVVKDIFAAGTSGNVTDSLAVGDGFVAGATAYIKGGTARNVYGGGWEGSVGKHKGEVSDSPTEDIAGETLVVIGHLEGTSFTDGIPAIERNAYGGGEGGAVFGTTNFILNKGYIGYRYYSGVPEDTSVPYTADGGGYYQEKLHDETAKDAAAENYLLDESGNVFGGGYVDNSSVDKTNVYMYGGLVRGCVFGGGEIAAVGRGHVNMSGESNSVRELLAIYKPGETHVFIFGGQVLRSVFGGGRGYDNLGRVGTLFSDGFVFGSTDVNIRGGEIGSKEGLASGFGNVFGGGDIGYVYSGTGKKKGTKTSDDNLKNGIPENGGGYYYENGKIANGMTKDCQVDVAPWCQVVDASGVTIDGEDFAQGDYVPVEYLNKLQRKTSTNANGKQVWDKLDISGIKIHNAIFAGGNVSSGSDQVYANAVTVYGNVTAALRDVYNRDLIEVGTEHTGGLYGDGNLTFVDGFRDLHIDNYGTDYYGLSQNITKAEYDELSDRERAYFVLKYKCVKSCTDRNGKEHSVSASANDALTFDEIRELFAVTDADTNPTWTTGVWDSQNGRPSAEYWEENGFCSLYAGRLLNTIQRADMVGIFGSRMVLQGARDRVPSKVDYTNYTINRVDEVSLNLRESQANDTGTDAKHGNYFGIYNIVNYLGNLTSDVFFTENANHPSAVRTTDTSNDANKADGETTYYQWKNAHRGQSNRNNGTSHNKVALASGVYLEIVREETETANEKKWGLITGVVELDLIDVRQGFGGGYVYAKNLHGTKTWNSTWSKVNLSPYNSTARTYRRFTYATGDANMQPIETSGNFVHSTKQIIDDCYPSTNAYKGADAAPAHYWYIKGSVYVYEQYISAYTGAPTAYAQTVNIPLTISASSHGKLTLRDVQPNRYAYRGDDGQPLGKEGTVIINNVTYRAGDPIDYWTWQTLKDVDKSRFEKEVYVVIGDCKIGGTAYAEGTVMLPDDVTTLKNRGLSVSYEEDGVEKTDKAFDYFFRPANNLSHDTGFLLTCDFNNPGVWDDYYTRSDNGVRETITKEAYAEKNKLDQALYTVGPTYTSVEPGVYGQRTYNVGDIITKDVVDAYPSNHVSGTDQASVEPAFVMTTGQVVRNKVGTEQHLYPGTPVYASDYDDATWAGMYKTAAKVCTSTIQLSETEFIYAGDLLSQSEIDDLKSKHSAILTDEVLRTSLSDAYYCTKGGLYGGKYYAGGEVHRALSAWSAMSESDRRNFRYNYDALDLLVDPTYGGAYGNKPQYDGYNPTNPNTAQYQGCTPLNPKVYSVKQPIDYEAEYTGEGALTFTDNEGRGQTIQPGYENRITRLKYERIPNEKVHWSPIEVTAPGNYYIVKEAFIRGDLPYTVGQVLDEEQYNSMSENHANIDVINIDESHAGAKNSEGKYEAVTYYFCREQYTIGEHGEGHGFTNLGITKPKTTYNIGDNVPRAVLIDEASYEYLVNKQTGFVIHGTAPIETTTLYVSRESDINSLSKEKIITVVYLYEYQESDESGHNITPISERHVINIHINFKSGVPHIPELQKPSVVLPGTTVGLKVPTPTPGAFEITNSGWEIYATEADAELHNGQPYVNNHTPMYWYQDGYWVAYYAQTYLGKTYSNAVQFSVANYHDLHDVMADKENHMFIDHPDVKRDPKIYLDQAKHEDESQLDLLKRFFDLSTRTEATDGHHPLNTAQVGDCKNLELIMRSDLTPSGSWTPIGDSNHCFEGTLHADGHTISGLDHSLFSHLCGEVYNLGVTGTFDSPGIANDGSGYLENCWVKKTDGGTVAANTKALFGNPVHTDQRKVHLVNCYYPKENGYSGQSGATEKPLTSFFNGEVAYDLNSFYLFKRYCDNKPASGDVVGYYYLKDGTTGNLTIETGRYESQPGPYLFEDERKRIIGSYVESRFSNVDFIYADGTIPEEADIRETEVNTGTAANPAYETIYPPIWPDDYIYFGQALTYGHVAGRDHQAQPSHILRTTNGRLLMTAEGNRVYRAPAYFGDSKMSAAHFNPSAVFAKKSSDNQVKAYEGMTAIDFTGSNGDVAGGYQYGLKDGRFYGPLLDDDGLTGFRNIDLTRNLLVYAGTSTTAASKTNETVKRALSEPVFGYEDQTYLNVAKQDTTQIHGHWIENGTAKRSHLLVDKNDFNAPMAYQFGNGNRMWYQRTPDRYVEKAGATTKGWEDVSLPFKAELVTAHQKGEITHFYQNSTLGHEYWLRELTNITQGTPEEAVGNFTYPDATGSGIRTVENTFLWDWYYSKMYDANTDVYQNYYASDRNFSGYPLQQAGTPYLIGFPGGYYYEFDLSGNFKPQHTAAPAPAQLDQQVITFASAEGASIGVSDAELANRKVNYSGYDYCPNYKNQSVEADDYLLSADGAKYERQDAQNATKHLLPFRPYFVTKSSGTRSGTSARYIIFSNEVSEMKHNTTAINDIGTDGDLIVKGAKKKIEVESQLDYTTDVRIVTPSGITLTTYAIEPGETIETRVETAGVYIVYGDNGKYVKKVIVK